MTELHERLARWGHAFIDGEEAIGVVRKIWDVGEEEGYWSERGRLAADAVWISAGHSESVRLSFVLIFRIVTDSVFVISVQWLPSNGRCWRQDGMRTSLALILCMCKRCRKQEISQKCIQRGVRETRCSLEDQKAACERPFVVRVDPETQDLGRSVFESGLYPCM